jgi:hypothetical protein
MCRVEVYRPSRGGYCVHHKVMMMETVRTSETSVHFNVTARRYIPEDFKLHSRRHDNVKSHIQIFDNSVQVV